MVPEAFRSIANSYAAIALVALMVVNAAVHGAASNHDRSCIRHAKRRSQHTETPEVKPTTSVNLSQPLRISIQAHPTSKWGASATHTHLDVQLTPQRANILRELVSHVENFARSNMVLQHLEDRAHGRLGLYRRLREICGNPGEEFLARVNLRRFS